MGKNAKEALLLEITRRLKAVHVAGLQDTSWVWLKQGVSNLIDKPEACHVFITWDYLPSALPKKQRMRNAIQTKELCAVYKHSPQHYSG